MVVPTIPAGEEVNFRLRLVPVPVTDGTVQGGDLSGWWVGSPFGQEQCKVHDGSPREECVIDLLGLQGGTALMEGVGLGPGLRKSASSQESIGAAPGGANVILFGPLSRTEITMPNPGMKTDKSLTDTNLLRVSIMNGDDAEYIDQAKLISDLTKAVEASQEFWAGFAPPSEFHVPINFYDNQQNDNLGGYGHYRGFVGFMPQNVDAEACESMVNCISGYPQITLEEVTSFLSHEYSHTRYNPSLFNPDYWAESDKVVNPRPEAIDTGILWAEGTAQWLQDHVLMKADVLDLPANVRRYNAELERYFCIFAEYQHKPGKVCQGNNPEFQNYGCQRQPYLRGCLLYHNWNAEIVEKSDGEYYVGDFILDMYRENYPGKMTIDRIQEASLRYLTEGILPDTEAYWMTANNETDAETIVIHPRAMGPCYKMISGYETRHCGPYFALNEMTAAHLGEEACTYWLARPPTRPSVCPAECPDQSSFDAPGDDGPVHVSCRAIGCDQPASGDDDDDELRRGYLGMALGVGLGALVFFAGLFVWSKHGEAKAQSNAAKTIQTRWKSKRQSSPAVGNADKI